MTRRRPPAQPPLDHEAKLGFPGHEQKQTVKVPDGDLLPWDLDTKFAVVGSDQDRIDGLPKAAGRARYTYDINLPGMLQAVILRSPIPRGRLTALDLDEARAMPGVAAVVALKDIGNRVRFVGDEVAAVAAKTLDQARDALEKIQAGFEPEEHVIDFLQSDGAPALDEDGQVTDPWPADGKVDGALDKAAHTHDATYRTEVQTHSSLETHGLVARWNDADLEVWCSTQATFAARGFLPATLRQKGYKVGSVEVHAEYVGGGFGSKFSPGNEGLAAAMLAKEANAPVKLMLDRYEEHTCTGNRPSALIQVRAGVDAAGKITAWDYRSWGGPGYSGQGGRTVYPDHYLDGAASRRSHSDLPTDTDAARSMRAPGWPQGFFGAELFLDELAHKAGVDPLAFRQQNDPQVIRAAQWRMGAEKFGWQQARNPKPGTPRDGDDPRWLRGAGLASARWGGMGGPGRPPATWSSLCRIHQDGTVEARNGAQDIGTGMKTVMALLTAEELGIPTALVKVTMGHTADPAGPGSGGSTTTPSLAPAVRHAAGLCRQQLADLVARQLGVEADQIVFRDGKVGAPAQAGKPMLSWQEACKLIGPTPIEARGERFPNYGAFFDGVCGCQFAEVLVDTWTGTVRVVRMLGIQDCGLVIARKLAESQVLGAMIQGFTFALHEQRIMDRRSGRMLNGDFSFYKIAGPADMPDMEAVMFTVMNGANNVGAVGLGEPPSVAAPAAIANAVFNAIGVPVRRLPITPDKVLAALAQRKGV